MSFFDIVLRPQETMVEDVKHVNMQEANRTIGIYGGIIGLLFGIIFSVFSIIFGAVAAGMLQNIPVVGVIAGLGLLSILIMPILGAIFALVFTHVGMHIVHFLAKLLGGTGTFQNNYYLWSRLLWPAIAGNIIINIVIFILNIIPILGLVIGSLLSFFWYFYNIYLTTVVISVANNISRLRALVVLLLPGIIIVTLLASTALLILVNPSTVQGDQCDSKFGQFVITQSNISDKMSQFVLVNQTGQSVTFNSVEISGVSSAGKPFSANTNLSDKFNANETKTVTVSHPSLGVGTYTLLYKFNYDWGNLTGLTASGSCRGTN